MTKKGKLFPQQKPSKTVEKTMTTAATVPSPTSARATLWPRGNVLVCLDHRRLISSSSQLKLPNGRQRAVQFAIDQCILGGRWRSSTAALALISLDQWMSSSIVVKTLSHHAAVGIFHSVLAAAKCADDAAEFGKTGEQEETEELAPTSLLAIAIALLEVPQDGTVVEFMQKNAALFCFLFLLPNVQAWRQSLKDPLTASGVGVAKITWASLLRRIAQIPVGREALTGFNLIFEGAQQQQLLIKSLHGHHTNVQIQPADAILGWQLFGRSAKVACADDQRPSPRQHCCCCLAQLAPMLRGCLQADIFQLDQIELIKAGMKSHEEATKEDDNIGGSAIEGSAVDRSAIDGSAIEGSAIDGSAIDGSAIEGSAIEGSAIDGSAIDGSAVAGSDIDGSAVAGRAIDGNAIDGNAIDGSAIDGNAIDGSAIDGNAIDGNAIDGSAVAGSDIDGSAIDGSAIDGSAVDGNAVDGSAIDGNAIDGSAGSAIDGNAVDGSAIDGNAIDGSAGSAIDGNAIDGSAIDGSAIDGSAVAGSDIDGSAVAGRAIDGNAIDGLQRKPRRSLTVTGNARRRRLQIRGWQRMELLTSPALRGGNLRLMQARSGASAIFHPMALESAIISHCESAGPIVLGPVRCFLLVSNCRNLTISAICPHIRLHQCEHITLFCQQQQQQQRPPQSILLLGRGNKAVRLAPYNCFYDGLAQELAFAGMPLPAELENGREMNLLLDRGHRIIQMEAGSASNNDNNNNNDENIVNDVCTQLPYEQFYLQPMPFRGREGSQFHQLFLDYIPSAYLDCWLATRNRARERAEQLDGQRLTELCPLKPADLDYLMRKVTR